MELYMQPVQVRWSDIDPNFHLRHSVYYDWAAMCRLAFLDERGLTPLVMKQLLFGPILFREEAFFRKEISYGDHVTINMNILKSRRDYSRWTITHEIKKQGDIFCASVTVDGAWLNVAERKLSKPPKEAVVVFDQMPRTADFAWED